MNRQLLNDALGEIDTELVERFARMDEIRTEQHLRRRRLRGIAHRFFGVAASFVVVLGLVMLSLSLGWQGGDLPSVDTTPSGEEVAPIHAVEDVLIDFDPDRIVWGNADANDNVPDVVDPAPETDFTEGGWDNEAETAEVSVGDFDNIGYRRWKGLFLDATLYNAINSAGDDAVFAVALFSVSKPSLSLDSYIYKGRTVRAIWNEYEYANALFEELSFLKRIAGSAGEASEEELALMLEKSERKLLETYYQNGVFDETKLSMDLTAAEERCNVLYTEYTRAVEAYMLEYSGLPDPSVLAREGYYVVMQGSSYFLFAEEDELAVLSEIILRHYDDEMLQNTFFCLATSHDLGVTANDIHPYGPSDDEAIEESCEISTEWVTISESVIPYPETVISATEYDIYETETVPAEADG